MRLSIVLSTDQAKFEAATFKGDLATSLDRIAALGYDGVELAIRDPARIDTDALLEQVSKRHLKVPAIGTGQAWGEEGLSFTDPSPAVRHMAVERVKSHFAGAKRFDAIIIIGLIRGVLRPGVEAGTAMLWLTDSLRECCDAAADHSVRLALEPINRYETTLINTVDQGLELLRSIGAANLGLLLDSFHMNIEEAEIATSIRLCGARIFHFHVADSNRRYPGGGHLDFKSILGSLGDAGYGGWISGEFLPLPTADIAAGESISYLRGITA